MVSRLLMTVVSSMGLFSAFPALAQSDLPMQTHWYHSWGGGGEYTIFGAIIAFFFLGGLVLVFLWELGWMVFGVRRHDSSSAAKDKRPGVLKERFARGEIDQQEFDKRSNTLST